MSNTILGTNYQLFVNTASGTTGMPLGYAQSAKVNKSTDAKKISSKDSAGYTYSNYGKNSISISTDVLYSIDLLNSQSGYTNLDYCWKNKIPVWCLWGHSTGTSPAWTLDTTKPYDKGWFIISSLELNASDDEYMSYSVSFDLYSIS